MKNLLVLFVFWVGIGFGQIQGDYGMCFTEQTLAQLRTFGLPIPSDQKPYCVVWFADKGREAVGYRVTLKSGSQIIERREVFRTVYDGTQEFAVFNGIPNGPVTYTIDLIVPSVLEKAI